MAPPKFSRNEDEIIRESLAEFQDLQTYRAVFAAQWEEIAELVLPVYRNTFYYGTYNFPGQKKTDRQVDSTAMLALSRFAAILDSLLTPRNMQWHFLRSDNDELNKDRSVREWFEQVTKILFRERYKPISNFSAQNQQQYQSLGAFGTGVMWIDQYAGMDAQRGLRYKAVPLGEMYLKENHQGQIDSFCRWFRLTKRQAEQQFGEDALPETIKTGTNSEVLFNFLHRVCPRENYDPERRDSKGKRWVSYYIALDGRKVLSEGGFDTFPVAASRYDQAPIEVYGRSPSMLVLPAIKTLNAEKRDFLTQGHRAGTPILLTTDDGVVDFSMRPGALNKGGMSVDGKPLVGVLPAGNIQVTKEMMDEERSIINDAFLVTLFQIMTETPQMTATEVVERINEKGILLAPTVGRQQSEYLGPMIDRELDLLARQHMIPPAPRVLQEAGAGYHVMYTSPLARAMRAQEVAGFSRTLETVLQIVNATGDPSPLDRFNFDVVTEEMAEIQAVPVTWLSSDDDVAKKRQARAKAAQQQQQIQAAPAQAAMMKAQAVQQKAGMQQQGGQGGPPPPAQ